MRFFPSLIIALMALVFSHFAKANPGANGMITIVTNACMREQTVADRTAASQLMIDMEAIGPLKLAKAEVPEMLLRSGKIHQTELWLEKAKCLHRSLTDYVSDGITVGKMNSYTSHRALIAHLALYRGLKDSEISRMGTKEKCPSEEFKDVAACELELKTRYIQETSMARVLGQFLDAYAEAVDEMPELKVSRLALKLEGAHVRELKRLRSLPVPVQAYTLETADAEAGALR